MKIPFLKIGGEPVELTLGKVKATVMQAVHSSGGWFSLIRESWAGAWQRNVTIDGPKDILSYSPVFACVTVVGADVGKLRPRVVKEDDDGICTEVERGSEWHKVLNKPNHYQNRIQFITWWIICKLLHGNTCALKIRNAQRKVVGYYLLDPQRVTPLVADNGDVYYQLSSDHLSRLVGTVTVPASEIVHDRMNCLWHPLIGVSPIYACGLSATMGLRIQTNSTKFFDNMSRPSGMLTAPGSISDEVAKRLKDAWEENFGGRNIGRLAVLGDNLKYEPMTIPPEQAQLIDQLKWTAEDIARVFHVPFYKIGGNVPQGSTIDALNQAYYSDCLQSLIESFELCMDEGLELPEGHYTDLDLDGLLRMDQKAQIETLSESVKGSIRAPNEARAKLNLKPVAGGDSPMSQQQNYSLEALAKRDAKEDPFATGPKLGDGAAGGAPNQPKPGDPPPTPPTPPKSIEEIVQIAALALPKPKDGKDVDPSIVKAAVIEAAHTILMPIVEPLKAALLKMETPPLLPPPAEDAEELADIFVKGLLEGTSEQPGTAVALRDVDSQVRASAGIVSSLASAVAENSKRVDKTMDMIVALAQHVEEAQRKSSASMDRVASVLAMPVVPIFDKNGMLKGSKRVERIEESA